MALPDPRLDWQAEVSRLFEVGNCEQAVTALTGVSTSEVEALQSYLAHRPVSERCAEPRLPYEGFAFEEWDPAAIEQDLEDRINLALRLNEAYPTEREQYRRLRTDVSMLRRNWPRVTGGYIEFLQSYVFVQRCARHFDLSREDRTFSSSNFYRSYGLALDPSPTWMRRAQSCHQSAQTWLDELSAIEEGDELSDDANSALNELHIYFRNFEEDLRWTLLPSD